jgi:cyclophilin family peptidyl-prolyl cis-trans isomerase
MALDAKDAPKTVNSFAYLANNGFYDGTLFHRIVTDFVDQGGDPTGTGSGGPGYNIPDEPPANGYSAGSVAMANSGTGTTGSQFFLVVSDNGEATGTASPYKYSALGTMDAAGLKVAKKINTFGTPSEKPSQDVYVLSVTVSEARHRRRPRRPVNMAQAVDRASEELYAVPRARSRCTDVV